MIGKMERNVGGRLIYRQPDWYYVLDCRTCPFKKWGTLSLYFNIWQNIGQLKIYFLAVEYDEAPLPSAERNADGKAGEGQS